ncbi:MAG: c-type cytochrome [Burkholderiaceae bacterium]
MNFRTASLTVAFFASIFVSSPALADAAMAKAKNCTACHAVDKKLIGPAFKAVALKYKEDGGAAQRLAGIVRKGGVGVWGQIPMPANPQVSEAEAASLVKWILSQ